MAHVSILLRPTTPGYATEPAARLERVQSRAFVAPGEAIRPPSQTNLHTMMLGPLIATATRIWGAIEQLVALREGRASLRHSCTIRVCGGTSYSMPSTKRRKCWRSHQETSQSLSNRLLDRPAARLHFCSRPDSRSPIPHPSAHRLRVPPLSHTGVATEGAGRQLGHFSSSQFALPAPSPPIRPGVVREGQTQWHIVYSALPHPMMVVRRSEGRWWGDVYPTCSGALCALPTRRPFPAPASAFLDPVRVSISESHTISISDG